MISLLSEKRRAPDWPRESSHLAEQYELALDAARMGIWEWDIETDESSWNSYHEELLGYPPGRTGRSRMDFIARVHPDDRARLDAAAKRAMDEKTYYESEYRVIWPDGKVRWLMSRGKAVYDEKGKPVKMYGTVLDITQRKELEEALKESLKARDEFLSMASHELRNPLTALKLSLQILQMRLKDNPGDMIEVKTVAHKIKSCLRHTGNLETNISNLLDISRVRCGSIQLDLESFDISRLVGDVVTRMAEQAAHSGYKIHFDGAGPAFGRWDRFRMDQVVTNLLCNAIKYGAQNDISVSVTMPGPETVRINVADRGIGIAQEDLGRIFHRYERAVEGRHEPGLGLGLFIVREIVEAHGGEVTVESQVGKGSVFSVILPAVIDRRAAADGQRPSTSERTTGPRSFPPSGTTQSVL